MVVRLNIVDGKIKWGVRSPPPATYQGQTPRSCLLANLYAPISYIYGGNVFIYVKEIILFNLMFLSDIDVFTTRFLLREHHKQLLNEQYQYWTQPLQRLHIICLGTDLSF